MTHFEEFKLRILDHASTAPMLNVTARLLAKEHGMAESHIREELVRMADAGWIRLSAWDGNRDRRHDEWPDASSLFSNTTGHGHVRIRLLSAGADLLSAAFSPTD